MPFVETRSSRSAAEQVVTRLIAWDKKYRKPRQRRKFTITSGNHVKVGKVNDVCGIGMQEIKFVPCEEARATRWEVTSDRI